MSCVEFYTIQSGDTLFLIAQRFNTSVAELIRINPGINPNDLRIGQRICVFDTADVNPSRCPIGTSAYEIRRGDTLSKIANQFGTTVASLLATNPDINPNNLRVGQTICVANNNPNLPRCTSQNYYVVRRGDTFFTIASAFGITVRALSDANPTANSNNLRIGQILCIPIAPSPISIVINIASKTLTVSRNGVPFREYPVATGKPSTPTPTGSFTIINKQVNPGGPYGTRWMGLSIRGYGIHGTNNPSSIGTAASNGCIRMYNRDVESLFDITPVGTPVRILP